MMGSKAFESPLISHARMRAIYRGLVETRVLSERLRKGRVRGVARGMEACVVAAAIDLERGDLVNTGGNARFVEYVREIGVRVSGGAATPAETKRALAGLAVEGRAFPGNAMDRLMCAVGEACALRAAAGRRVAVAYVDRGELKPVEWRRLLEAVNALDAPLIVVLTPGPKERMYARLGESMRRAAVKVHVPHLPVDAGDALAIYRVMQESVGRARGDSRGVVIECIACGVDPVAMMGGQLVKKGICTERWVAAVEADFRRRF